MYMERRDRERSGRERRRKEYYDQNQYYDPNRYYSQEPRRGMDGPYRQESPGRRRPGKEKRKTTFGDVVRILLMLAALAVFCFSGYQLYGFYREYKAGTDEYSSLANDYTGENETEDLAALEEADDQAQSVAGRELVTVVENGQEVSLPVMNNPINFAELSSVNSDIVGWIRIRALDISYPVVQTEDNDYYLHTTFEGASNIAGCIFMNCYNKPDFTDQNTIIYGHNMRNGSMFGTLSDFQDEEVYNKSKYFWIFTPDFIYQYRIFSASVVNQTGLTYQTSFSDEDFQEFVNTAFQNSVVDNTGLQVTEDDRIVTLSTCTGDDSTRFVVMGRLAQVYASKK